MPQLSTLSAIEAVELPLRNHPYDDLKEVLDYWDAKRRTRFAPARADIDPVDLVRSLPRILLAEVCTDPFDIRCRLVGTAITEQYGFDATGMSISSIQPVEFGEMIWSHYKDCIVRQSLLLHLIQLQTKEKARSYARLVLPLSEDGKAVTMIMAVGNEEQNTEELRMYFAEMSGQELD